MWRKRLWRFASAQRPDCGAVSRQSQTLRAAELGTFNNTVSFLTQRVPGELIFLDELEGTDESIRPTLAGAMLDFKIILGSNAMELSRFVVVATARTESNLPPLLRSCFAEIVKIEQYSKADISEYTTGAAQANSLGISQEAVDLFCTGCSSPAQILKLMDRARLSLKAQHSDGLITKEVMAGVMGLAEAKANS